MRTFEEWMDAYSRDHQHPTNKLIHEICVPTILFSFIGILWSLPTPDFFDKVPYFNWGTLFVLISLIFYIRMNFKMFLGITLQVLLMCVVCHKLYELNVLLPVCLGLFFMAWIGQFIGHKIEGKKPSFFDDMTFLMIGPMWVTRYYFKKLGITV